MTCGEANSDLDLAWKVLDIARTIVAKIPERTMEKVSISYALAEVSMKREDRDTAIGYYLQALAILKQLFRPNDLRVAQLNIHICAKAISACQSLVQNLEKAKEALLLADKDVSASAAKGQSGKFTLEDKISSLNRILARLQKKLEELEQAMSTPCSGIDKIVKRVISQTSHDQSVSNTAAATGSTGSSVNDSGIVSRGIKRANEKLISAEPSPKRLAEDDSPSVKCDHS
uniref:Uncharacterized protein n=1 Tax=Avena sativa TaxID=4498 RepID=A0ACD6A2Q6_AVESA